MSKRFTETVSVETIHDNLTGIDYKPNILTDELLKLINDLNDENEHLKEKINNIEFKWEQNFIKFNKDKLYVKDNNIEINLKDRNLFISVFIPEIEEYYKFNYIVTGRTLHKEYFKR